MAHADFAIIVTLDNETYEDGLREAQEIAEGLGQEGINASAVTEYERKFKEEPFDKSPAWSTSPIEHERIIRLHGVYEFDESGHRYPA